MDLSVAHTPHPDSTPNAKIIVELRAFEGRSLGCVGGLIVALIRKLIPLTATPWRHGLTTMGIGRKQVGNITLGASVETKK